jgi:hypothetical protein
MQSDTESTPRRMAAWLLWAITLVLAVAVIVSFFFIGPFGFVVLLAVGGVIWLMWSVGASAGGGPPA